MYLSLDEMLYTTRVGVAFHQYNKDKSAKYGLLFRSINSAEVPYTYTSIIYPGKAANKPGPCSNNGCYCQVSDQQLDKGSQHKRV